MRRGVSPIIATILLIIMTVGIAALMYTWMSGLLTSLTTTAERQMVQQQVGFTMRPIAVYNNRGNASLHFSVQNTGAVGFNINNGTIVVVVRDSVTQSIIGQVTSRMTGCTLNLATGTNTHILAPGQYGEYNFTCTSNFPYNKNNIYELTLTLGPASGSIVFTIASVPYFG